jgi:hypothetical protein
MHESDLAESVETALQPSRRKWLWRAAVLVLVLLVLAVIPGYRYVAARRHLQEAFDRADRLDPGWSLMELDAQRRHLPDEENGADLITAAQRWLPRDWPSWENVIVPSGVPTEKQRHLLALGDTFHQQPSPVRLTPAQVAALREELDRAAKALAEARKLVGTPWGRHPVTYTPDWIGTLYPTVQETRNTSRLLAYAALLRAHDGDLAGALADCLAIRNAGRSVGDEPGFIGQFVRKSCDGVAVQTLERILAQGQAAEADLASLQRHLEDEEAQPLFLIAARGERAGMDLLLAGLEKGNLPVSYVDGLGQDALNPLESVRLRLPGSLMDDRASLLEWMTELVEIAKLPAEEQRLRIEQLEAGRPSQHGLVRLMALDVRKVAQRFQRNQAGLRCAVSALAVERYWLRHRRWPENLEALAPDLLRVVPGDPFDGKPLRYSRLADGVVIYSVGPDGKDDGGNLSRSDQPADGTDVGFRLWDVTARRRPAPEDKQAK